MVTQQKINQFQSINPSMLNANLKEGYEFINQYLSFGDSIDSLNSEKEFVGAFDVFFKGYESTVSKPKMTTTSTAVKTAPKQAKSAVQQSKPTGSTATKAKTIDPKGQADSAKRAAAQTPSGNNTNAQKTLDRANLQKSVQEKYELVKQNARFKNQIGEELTNYLKTNVVRLGLGGLPIDYEIEQLKAKDKFYTNLLKNDRDDFKAIAKRLGLTFKTQSNMSTPSAYRKKDEKGKPMPAQAAVKSKPDNRTAKQKDNDAWNWLK